MNNIKVLNSFFDYHQQLDDFITSIHAIKNQQSDYEITFKDWTKTKDFTVVQKENESNEEVKMRAETILDQIYELNQRNDLILQEMNIFLQSIDLLKFKTEKVLKELNDDKVLYDSKIRETERFICDKIEFMRKQELKEYEEAMRKINEKYDKELRASSRYMKIERLTSNLSSIITETQQHFIQSWTSKKCESILFDSDIDNWNKNTSIFDKKVFGKRNLIFIVEDTVGNKFGGYIDTEINNYKFTINNEWCGEWIEDKKAFIFSLESNKRLPHPMKFEIKNDWKSNSFILYKPDSDWLFQFGGGDDFAIRKEYRRSECTCKEQHSYNYHGKKNALRGEIGRDKKFTVKRVVVIQMI